MVLFLSFTPSVESRTNPGSKCYSPYGSQSFSLSSVGCSAQTGDCAISTRSMNSKFTLDGAPVLPNAAERRGAAQLAEQERALGRQQALDSLSAWDAMPSERIRRWEDLHALALPRAAEHPLLAVIAALTKLTLDDVRDEQQRRRAILQAGASRKEAT